MKHTTLIALVVLLAVPMLMGQRAPKQHNALDHVKQVVKDKKTAVAVADPDLR